MKPLPNKNMTLAELDAYIEERRKKNPDVTPFEAFQEVKYLTEPLTDEQELLVQKIFNDWVKEYEQRASIRSGLWGLLYVLVFTAIMLWWCGPAKCVP